MADFLNKLENVKLLALDVDGTLTDGQLLILEDGTELRSVNIKDGLAIRKALDAKLKIAIISGSGNEGLDTRFKKLGVPIRFWNRDDKKAALEKILIEESISAEETLFMGDDLTDLPCINICGLSASPSDAVYEVKQAVDYVAKPGGGKGAVREIIELILKARDEWKVD